MLAELAGSVYTVEIIDELAQRAVQRLKQEGYTNVEVRVGNGYFGWPEQAPFEKIIVTASRVRIFDFALLARRIVSGIARPFGFLRWMWLTKPFLVRNVSLAADR